MIYVGKFSLSPYSSFISNSGLLIITDLTIIFINLFIIHSIGLQESKLNKHLYAILGIYYLNIVLNLFTLYALSLQIISLAVAYNTLIFFPMLFYSVYKTKNSYAYRLLLSFVPLVIGGIIFLCKVVSIVESNLFTENSYFIGSLLQIILFSFLLSQKFTTSMKLNLEYQKKILSDAENFANALQEEKERVTNAYFELEASQKQLIQSDRMITLGTLVAGVAHEINTPLGAIKASGENINISLNGLMQAISDVIPDSLRNDWSLVTKILEKSKTLSQSLSSKESRSLKKKIKENLETQEVVRAEEIAEIFLELGIYKDDSLQKEILSTQGYIPILSIAHLMFGILKKANTIEISAERVSKIVKSLKSYMHFDSSEEMVPAALHETIETVLTILHSKLKAGIEVQTHYEAIPFIYCFPDELGQIITNLIHNSIQALDGTGKISIEVKTIGIPDLQSIHSPFPISMDDHNSFDEKYIFDKFLTLSIEDNGPGIPEEIQKKIFEPFFTTKKAGEGSGLGLHIIRKIIDKHNGYLELFSKPGSTKFVVGIPARTALKTNTPTP
jgi:two-component system, NtrC family, sensor kinase